MQPQRYLCRKSKLASECAPLFTYLLFDRPISMFFLHYYIYCSAIFKCRLSMNENCLCVLVVTKTAKVSVSGVGLGLDHAGLGLGLPGLDNISGLGFNKGRRI